MATIRSEGGLLPADILARVAALDADLGGLALSDFHLAANERLGEAIARSWARLTAAWGAFSTDRDGLPAGDHAGKLTRERWLLPLFSELGYGRLIQQPGVEIEGKTYAVFCEYNHSPVHLVGAGVPLDRRTAGVRGAADQSPHSVVQELLNRSSDRLWGIVTNGLSLRLLRDNVTLTRQAYVEFDIEAILAIEAYEDFALLWLCTHQSRLEAEVPEQCWLERWTRAAQRDGTRALGELRSGVERAIEALGRGFLAQPANTALHDALRTGGLDGSAYYRELLRLIYRLLFLFVAEDRDALVLPDDGTAERFDARERYDRYYATKRLRRLSVRRRGGRAHDLYEQVKLLSSWLHDTGQSLLALPALGSALWSPGTTPHVSDARLGNEALLEAIRELSFVEGGRRPVDFRNLGAEELGSVYESLLELHPAIDRETARFTLTTAAGHERKQTGSYYTPTSLIGSLLETALDPMIDTAVKSDDPERALLDLTVCDPACGSGHFLIAAANRIAKRLAAVREHDSEPAPEAIRHALRDVVSRCIYGVDVNPMAVELCKVSLWMEALDPGRPLSFLDAHVKCGNSLFGTAAALIDAGIPDDAFRPLDGDDTALVTSLREQNKAEREGQLTLEDVAQSLTARLEADAAAMEAASDDSLVGLHEKELRFTALASSDAYDRAKATADAWCAAVLQRKIAGAPRITTGVVRRIAIGDEAALSEVKRAARLCADRYRLFQWEVEFPLVFGGEDPGFDVVLGNPPWDQLIFQEREFFAARSPEIAAAGRAAQRQKLIESLKSTDPALYQAFADALMKAKSEQHFLRRSGVLPLSGVGRHLITGGLFVELARRITSGAGTVGLIVPTEVATGDTLRLLFQDMIEQRSLVSLFDFENGNLFPGVHNHYKFCLLTLAGSLRPAESATFAFYAKDVIDLSDDQRRFTLSSDEFSLLNPTSRTCPIFRDGREARITIDLYRDRGVIGARSSQRDSWNLATRPGLFNMALQSGLFRTAAELGCAHREPLTEYACATSIGYVPLYEGKMIHQFDHRWSSLGEGDSDVDREDPDAYPRPRYWVAESEVASRARGRTWFLCYRDVTNATNERTAIAAVVPATGIAHNLPIVDCHLPHIVLAALNSFVVDFVTRTKVGGMHLTIAVLEQLPLDQPERFRAEAPWCRGIPIADWVRDRVLELCYTAMDLAPFASALGYTGPPFRWDDERRARLRADLDAAFFHLYGLREEDIDFVMESFPIVKQREERTVGDFRTKALILEAYRAMTEAAASGARYETAGDPPPADPRAAHPWPEGGARAALG